MATRRSWSLAMGAALLLQAGLACAQAGETVKIAFIDPQSGPFANIGQNILRTFQLSAERASAKGGVKYEVVAFDNKASPQESLNVLKAAIDQGFRYVAQGNGSGAAAAILDAVNKHNERNPGKEVVFFNYAAVDPSLTNDKCSFWHFRFDADTSMKMEAMVTAMSEDPSVKKVYIIGQNYAHGQQVSRYAKEIIARKTPAVQVVGDELHPLGQVKDFAPYVAKIKQSGADTVITGNWGSDLSLLVKAANEAGYNGKFYTYYTGVTGTPTALGQNGDGRVFQVGYAYYNMGGEMGKWGDEFKAKFNDDFYTGAYIHIFEALTNGMAKAKSTDPVKVAAAMEGLKFKSFNGDVEMRKTDHQLQQPLYISVWTKTDAKHPYSPENTGMTLTNVKTYESFVSSTPTSCQMKRP